MWSYYAYLLLSHYKPQKLQRDVEVGNPSQREERECVHVHILHQHHEAEKDLSLTHHHHHRHLYFIYEVFQKKNMCLSSKCLVQH